MCRSCWSATSSAAASSPSWSAPTRCCRESERALARRLHRQQVPRRSCGCSTAASQRSASAPGCARSGSCRSFPAPTLLPAEDSLALRRRPALPRGGDGRGRPRVEQHPHRGAGIAADRQFRRSRPAARRAGCRARHGPAGAAVAARCGTGDPAGLESDDRRSRIPAPRGLGHRHPRASPPRRTGSRSLRRLSDARPDHCRSARHRGPAGDGAGARPARHRHGARRRKAARPSVSASMSRPECRSRATKCISARPPGRGWRARCCIWPAGPEGAVSADGLRRRLLSARPLRQRRVPPRLSRRARRRRAANSPTSTRIETTLDALADHLEASLDLSALLAAARPPRLRRQLDREMRDRRARPRSPGRHSIRQAIL